MPNQTIRITGINPTTNKLILDHEILEVNSKWEFRKITWKIKHGVPVDSFQLKAKTSRYPFETAIPTTFEKEVSLKVNKDEPFIDWEYYIHWKDGKGNTFESDPVIAIRPSKVDVFFDLKFLVTMMASLLAAMGISLFFINKKNKTK